MESADELFLPAGYSGVMQSVQTTSESETQALAARLARTATAGEIYLLEGPLGAGKSAFARGFIRALCGDATDIPSPTFTLVQTYESSRATIWHFDLYRLSDPDDLYELGWEDALSGICLVEWPERAGPILPRDAKKIRLTPRGGTTRTIEFE